MEFTTTGRRRASKVGLIVHHVRYLAIEDLAHRDGIPVTTVPRTLVDLPAVADARTAELALESALRAGLTRVDQVKAALSRTPRSHRGRPALCAILDMHPLTATESELETRVWQLLRDAGLPPPTRQHKIRGPHGEVVARVDFAFVEAKLAIEADGYGSHSNPRDFRRDRKRHNALTRLGWTIYRVTWADALGRPHEVGLEIAELLRRCARPTVLSRWSIEP